jgi:hypothetical protein
MIQAPGRKAYVLLGRLNPLGVSVSRSSMDSLVVVV